MVLKDKCKGIHEEILELKSEYICAIVTSFEPWYSISSTADCDYHTDPNQISGTTNTQ